MQGNQKYCIRHIFHFELFENVTFDTRFCADRWMILKNDLHTNQSSYSPQFQISQYIIYTFEVFVSPTCETSF